MQIASITFDGEKKKSANYIIPATFFQSLSPTKKKIAKILVSKTETVKTPLTAVVEKPKPALERPVLKNLGRLAKEPSKYSLKGFNKQKDTKKTLYKRILTTTQKMRLQKRNYKNSGNLMWNY